MELLLASGSLDRHMHVWHIKKLKGLINNTTNNKLLKSLDESSNDGNKNPSGSEKKPTKRTPLTDKANNVLTSIEKKSNSNATSTQRTISTTTK
jgi:hypothetical protein